MDIRVQGFPRTRFGRVPFLLSVEKMVGRVALRLRLAGGEK
jgi:hypothetical protein